MMTCLGWQMARNIAGIANAACTFDSDDFPTHRLYTGNPWFLPLVGGRYRLRDQLDCVIA